MKEPRILAYHQVGSDQDTPEERRRLLEEIMEAGEVVPAIGRVRRSTMREECFGDASGCQDIPSFRGSPEAIKALEKIANEKLALLPEDGSTHTMFNCLDLVAGDFERVFLSINDWYSSPNGFVFDAEELIKKGAGYRLTDLLGFYRYAVENATNRVYPSVSKAKRGIQSEIDKVLSMKQDLGEEAIRLLKEDCSDDMCPGEIVWPGPLPLDLATEVWENGERIF